MPLPLPPSPAFSTLRFMAMLKAAREFGLDESSANAVALRFDPRRPDLDAVADALSAALLEQSPFAAPDAV